MPSRESLSSFFFLPSLTMHQLPTGMCHVMNESCGSDKKHSNPRDRCDECEETHQRGLGEDLEKDLEDFEDLENFEIYRISRIYNISRSMKAHDSFWSLNFSISDSMIFI